MSKRHKRVEEDVRQVSEGGLVEQLSDALWGHLFARLDVKTHVRVSDCCKRLSRLSQLGSANPWMIAFPPCSPLTDFEVPSRLRQRKPHTVDCQGVTLCETALEEVIQCFPAMKSLRIHHFWGDDGDSADAIRGLTQLQSLTLMMGKKRWVGRRPGHMMDRRIFSALPNLGMLTRLLTLSVESVTLDDAAISHFPQSLTSLHIGMYLPSYNMLPDLVHHLVRLREFSVRYLTWSALLALCTSPRLRVIRTTCWPEPDLEPEADPEQLQAKMIVDSDSITCMLGRLTEIEACPETLECFRSIAASPTIKKLIIPRSADAVRVLRNDVQGNPDYKSGDLQVIRLDLCTKLTSLEIHCCWELALTNTGISRQIRQLTALTFLDISHSRIDDFSFLANLPHLHTLIATNLGCIQLRTVPRPVPPSLQHIDFALSDFVLLNGQVTDHIPRGFDRREHSGDDLTNSAIKADLIIVFNTVSYIVREGIILTPMHSQP